MSKVLISTILVISGIGIFFVTFLFEKKVDPVEFANKDTLHIINYFLETAEFEFEIDNTTDTFSITKDESKASIELNSTGEREFVADWDRARLNSEVDLLSPPEACNYIRVDFLANVKDASVEDSLSSRVINLVCIEDFGEEEFAYF